MALLGRLVTWIIVSSVALIELDLLAIVSQRCGSDVVVAPFSPAIVAESALVAESVPDATACRKRKYFTTYVDGKRHRIVKEASFFCECVQGFFRLDRWCRCSNCGRACDNFCRCEEEIRLPAQDLV